MPGTRSRCSQLEAWSLVPAAEGWDLNPRDRKPGPTVFETAAFGRSATPPKSGIRHQAPGSRIFSGWCLVPWYLRPLLRL